MATTLSIILLLVLITWLFIQQPPFGKLPSAKRRGTFANSKQFENGSFKNIEQTRLMAEGVSYFGMLKEFFSKQEGREPSKALPHVVTDLKSLPDKPLVIWFGHSSYLLHLEGKNILVDPVFSGKASPVQYVGVGSYPGTNTYQPEDFPPLDAIIITHDHYDHLDYPSIIKLKSITKNFYTSLGVGSHLERWGVPSSMIHEFDWWKSTTILNDMTLTATPARHFSGRVFIRNKTLWSSFVLRTKELNLFLGGDSGYDGSFKTIGEKFGPFDLVILETGQYDRKWPQIHMMPEEAVQASVDLKGKVMLPVHWGKFTLAVHPWKDPIQRVLQKAAELNVTVTTPKIGEPVEIGGAYPSPREPWWENV